MLNFENWKRNRLLKDCVKFSSSYQTNCQGPFQSDMDYFVKSHLLQVLRIRIRDLVPFWPPDPGSGLGKKKQDSDPGWKKPGSYFRKLRNQLFGLKYFNYLMRIRDPGWKKFGCGIRDGKNSDPGCLSRIRTTAYSEKKVSSTLLLVQIAIGTPCSWRWCPTDRARAPRRR